MPVDKQSECDNWFYCQLNVFTQISLKIPLNLILSISLYIQVAIKQQISEQRISQCIRQNVHTNESVVQNTFDFGVLRNSQSAIRLLLQNI